MNIYTEILSVYLPHWRRSCPKSCLGALICLHPFQNALFILDLNQLPSSPINPDNPNAYPRSSTTHVSTTRGHVLSFRWAGWVRRNRDAWLTVFICSPQRSSFLNGWRREIIKGGGLSKSSSCLICCEFSHCNGFLWEPLESGVRVCVFFSTANYATDELASPARVLFSVCISVWVCVDV